MWRGWGRGDNETEARAGAACAQTRARTACANARAAITTAATASTSSAASSSSSSAAASSSSASSSAASSGHPPPPPCIQTDEDGCLSVPDFETQASGLAQKYRDNDLSFAKQWGLETINADWAYANVELLKGQTSKPGAGVTIGFIDTGIDTDHPQFAGKTVTEVFLDGATNETGDEFSHGTAVASIAAGLRAGSLASSANGVAWGADIAMFAIRAGSGSDPYVPISLTGLSSADSTWAGLINSVLNWRDGQRAVDFLNLSVGYSGIIDSYSRRELRDNFGTAIAAMAQTGASDKTILIWSAGNAHGDPCDPADVAQCENGKVNAVSVEVLPGLVRRIPELRGHSLAVAAVGEDGKITGFSNRCGIAADYCLAAPGEEVTLAYYGPREVNGQVTNGHRGTGTGRGTSYAAPMVAGGLAVMKQLFRDQLLNTELVTRLLTTADKSGDYADPAVYGQGKMDLKCRHLARGGVGGDTQHPDEWPRCCPANHRHAAGCGVRRRAPALLRRPGNRGF